MERLMEICVDSVDSAMAAVGGGANRLELCQDLTSGGLTPSVGLLKMVRKYVNVPIFVLIRPRVGDFVFTSTEIEVMQQDILQLVENGADGLVIGALTPEFGIDVPTCKRLMNVSPTVPVTFNRAFDLCIYPRLSLDEIIKLGCRRVITSGQDSDAHSGIAAICDFIVQADGKITIVPAGGIDATNLEDILTKTGAKEFHSSASMKDYVKYQNDVDLYNFGKYKLSCQKSIVMAMSNIAKRL